MDTFLSRRFDFLPTKRAQFCFFHIMMIIVLGYILVQLYKFKIILIAAGFLIIESIDALVDFLHLLGSIIKRGGGVLHGCYCHYHIGSENSVVRAFETLRLYLKYLTHKHSFLSSLCYMDAPAFLPKLLVVYFQGAKIMQTSAMKACFQIAECS